MEMFQDAGGASGDQMSVAALAGLYMMLIAGIAFAAIIAICEFTWRKRKLAVDENVSFRALNIDTWKDYPVYGVLSTFLYLHKIESLLGCIDV